jgi:hypothetical protein
LWIEVTDHFAKEEMAFVLFTSAKNGTASKIPQKRRMKMAY